MIVAGVMSGTSADGINVALVEISGSERKRARTPVLQSFELLGQSEFPYRPAVRSFILSTMNSTRASVADLARLNVLLGELYADAVQKTAHRLRVKVQLVGCHGQTIYHQGEGSAFLGTKLATTWQTGEGAVIAARVGVPVVSDFRPADMAAGGKGAPLVPFLDFLVYRHPRVGRIVQNIGGIANLTAIPAGASQKQVIAFDTGPGNMVIDAVTEQLFGEPYDRDGRIAASGTVLDSVLADVLREPSFQGKPPKTAGREEFGREFVGTFIARCGKVNGRDVVASATALTASSIVDALRRFVLRRQGNYRDFVVSGGGTRNATLMAMLANALHPLGLQIHSSDEFGLPAEAKEAVAFAVLAYETWHRRPSNIPSATGAKRPAILGKISYA
ncbi:MAG: anhydro-N-acetylmuramic acid kinase [Terriglobales bacterium]